MNPYINVAVSLRFMVLKEFVPGPQTHVSLCGAVGGTPGGKRRSTTEPFRRTARTHIFFAELSAFRSALYHLRL